MVKNLKKIRNESGISQQQLADVIGVSQQSINKYENQGVEPDIATLIKIADYFSISVDNLIGHTVPDSVSVAVTEEEYRLVRNYRTLNMIEKEIVKLIIDNRQQRPAQD